MDTSTAHDERKKHTMPGIDSETTIIRHRPMLCFEQCNPLGPGQDDVPALLRRVADTIEELGDVEVCDLVLHPRITAPIGQDWPSIVVYYRERSGEHDQELPVIAT